MLKKVAVTGASGFIGGHLLPKLLKNGFEVKVLDFGDGNYPRNVRVVAGNLFSDGNLSKFLDGADVVIHLAGQVLPGATSMQEGNVETTRNLIKECQRLLVKKIIFSSTVAVYGDSNGKVFKETDKCLPNTDYSESKLEAEKIIVDWSKNVGCSSTIFRFFSVYGQGNKKGAVYNLCRDFIEKGRVTIYGSGKQRRDLVYVEDAAEVLKKSITDLSGGIYNVGTGKYYSILDMVSVLERVGGKKCKIDFEKSESEKVGEVLYSVEKLKKDLGWLPLIDIKDGIKKVYKDMLKNG